MKKAINIFSFILLTVYLFPVGLLHHAHSGLGHFHLIFNVVDHHDGCDGDNDCNLPLETIPEIPISHALKNGSFHISAFKFTLPDILILSETAELKFLILFQKHKIKNSIVLIYLPSFLKLNSPHRGPPSQQYIT
ncbi:MAG: hypothetical protein OEZ34_03010 [Spirochaetia bacterium]|nr:hypothetical protein [Spirochaetia bacterium]